MIAASSNMEGSGDLGKSCFSGVVGTRISFDWLQKRGEEKKWEQLSHTHTVVKGKEAIAEWICLVKRDGSSTLSRSWLTQREN